MQISYVALAAFVLTMCSCSDRIGAQLRDAAIKGGSSFVEQQVHDLLTQLFDRTE